MSFLTAESLEDWVYLDPLGGGIYVESYFEDRIHPDELKLLLSCIEDNIYDTIDGESIDYKRALKDFREAKEKEKAKCPKK